MPRSPRSGWWIVGYAALALGLSAWAGVAWREPLWGLGFGGALPVGPRAVLLLGALGLLILAALGTTDRLGDALGRGLERHPWLGRGLLLAAGLPLLYGLRSQQLWYGTDNAILDLHRLYTTNIGSGLWLRLGDRLVGGLGWVEAMGRPEDARVAMVSMGSGLLWLLLMFGIGRRLCWGPRRALAMALLLASPGLALFAGHREVYFVPALALALYAGAALGDLERPGLPWRSGVCAGLALSAHLLNAALLPSLLWVAAAQQGRRTGRVALRLGVTTVAMLAVYALPLLYRWHFEWDGSVPTNIYDTWGSLAHLKPGENGLLWAFEPHDHPGFWSSDHLRDVGNALLFHAPWVGPLPWLLLASLRQRRRDPRLLFAAALWLGSLGVLLLDRPFGGHFGQWAHNGGFSLCSALLLVATLNSGDTQPSPRARGALLALMAYQCASLLLLAHLGLGPTP